MTRKPTADERDRAIVAKAGSRWESMPRGLGLIGAPDTWPVPVESAAARILTRIVREEAKRGKGK